MSRAASEGFGSGAQHFTDQASLIRELQTSVNANAIVLVKGSRSSAMEKVTAALAAPGEN